MLVWFYFITRFHYWCNLPRFPDLRTHELVGMLTFSTWQLRIQGLGQKKYPLNYIVNAQMWVAPAHPYQSELHLLSGSTFIFPFTKIISLFQSRKRNANYALAALKVFFATENFEIDIFAKSFIGSGSGMEDLKSVEVRSPWLMHGFGIIWLNLLFSVGFWSHGGTLTIFQWTYLYRSYRHVIGSYWKFSKKFVFLYTR